MLGRQPVRPLPRIVLDDASGGHRAQPFAHVALLGASRCGDVRAGARGQRGHRIEQPDLVPDARHQRYGGVVENTDHPVGELLGEGRIELGSHSGGCARGASAELVLLLVSVLLVSIVDMVVLPRLVPGLARSA